MKYNALQMYNTLNILETVAVEKEKNVKTIWRYLFFKNWSNDVLQVFTRNQPIDETFDYFIKNLEELLKQYNLKNNELNI